MRIRGLGRVRRVMRRARARLFSGVLILAYHRVTKLDFDPCLLAVTPEHFDEHLQVLRKEFTVMSLSELAEDLSKKKITKRGVVITFDDGYSDALDNAKPLLMRHGIPATVFVTSGHLRTDREFWWDELERLVFEPREFPAGIAPHIDHASHSPEFHDEGVTSDNPEGVPPVPWNLSHRVDKTGRQRLFRQLHGELKGVPPSDRDVMLEKMFDRVGISRYVRRSHRRLVQDEIRTLAEGGTVEIGAHTVNHPSLATLPLLDQHMEISKGRSDLEEILQRDVRCFAYPYGMPGEDYTMDTMKIVREAGFLCGCSAKPDIIVDNGTDLFELPRVGVRDCDGVTFARKLKSWI